MKRRGDEGYVLAAALAALFAMSVVAAALVAASVNEVRRVVAVERASADDAALDAAIIAAASNLVREPSARTLKFDGEDLITVGGRAIRVTAGWESDKLDVNAASPTALDRALIDQGVEGEDRSQILRRLEMRRSAGTPLSLVDDVLEGVASSERARAVLTTFGGRSDWTDDDVRETIAIGVPAPGSRVWVAAQTDASSPHRAREAVFLVTGDPAAPVRILDIRSVRGAPGEGRDGS